jgi:hypothetical protein
MRDRAHSRRRLRIGAILVTGAAIAMPTVAVQPALGQAASPTEVVHVGALLSITGGGSSLGNTSRAALEVARDQWNQRLARTHQNRRVELDVIGVDDRPSQLLVAATKHHKIRPHRSSRRDCPRTPVRLHKRLGKRSPSPNRWRTSGPDDGGQAYVSGVPRRSRPTGGRHHAG